ncbi:MAG TPA: YihY/virulence factor BrkB family protein, partial [Actinomycetota bacterium]|nr:YihY/virulence factor BrkB family protein [Actinomycetota bacterium]
ASSSPKASLRRHRDRPVPDSPLELEPRDWRSTLRRTGKEIKDDRVTLVAAGMAYYFFLAIFPALIAFVGVMGLIDAEPAGLIQSIEATLPPATARVLTQPMEQADNAAETASLVAAISGIAVALWSASAGMVALQSGLNVAYEVPQDRKFVGKRAIALVLLVATGLLGGVPSPFFTFGEGMFFEVLGWVLTLAAIAVLFSLYYFLGPNRESPTWQWVSPGGVIGAILWVAASVLFFLYVQNFSSYGKTYGSYAGVVVLILWLYFSSLAVLVGGELNAELERQAEGVA